MSETGQTTGERGSIVPWETLERWSATAFLVAGGVMVVFWALVALEVFADVSSPQALLAMPALVATTVGLLGLYPELADRAPRLSRAGVGLLAVATVGLVVIFVWVLVGRVLPAAGVEMSSQPPGVVIASTVGAYVLTVLLFGVASLRTAVPSRTVGLLLLALVGAFTIPLVAGVVWGSYPGEWMAVVVSGLQAGAIVAIGYTLRNGGARADTGETAVDSAA